MALPSDLAIFFLLSILCVLPSVCPVFGIIFSTRDLRRNLCIWWCVRTTSDDVIFKSKVPSCQVAIYWILKIQFFLSIMTSPKNTFFKVRLIPDSTWSDLSKEPIKSGYLCRNTKKRFPVKAGPKRQVSYNCVKSFNQMYIVHLTLRTSCHGIPYFFRIFTQVITFYWLVGNIWPRWIRNKSNFWIFFGWVWRKEKIGFWGSNICLPDMMGLLT